MKRQIIIGWLFFSAVWGIFEAVLGGSLFGYKIPYASVPLTVIGFAVLALARVFLPYLGMATMIAIGATLFKFLNAPIYKCHYLGIIVMGISFDLFFALFKIKQQRLAAIAAVYFNNLAFAVLMLYVIGYQPWIQGGLEKLGYHVLVSGTIAAILSAAVLPVCFKQGQMLRLKNPTPFQWQPDLLPRVISLGSTACWVASLAIFSYHILLQG